MAEFVNCGASVSVTESDESEDEIFFGCPKKLELTKILHLGIATHKVYRNPVDITATNTAINLGTEVANNEELNEDATSASALFHSASSETIKNELAVERRKQLSSENANHFSAVENIPKSCSNSQEFHCETNPGDGLVKNTELPEDVTTTSAITCFSSSETIANEYVVEKKKVLSPDDTVDSSSYENVLKNSKDSQKLHYETNPGAELVNIENLTGDITSVNAPTNFLSPETTCHGFFVEERKPTSSENVIESITCENIVIDCKESQILHNGTNSGIELVNTEELTEDITSDSALIISSSETTGHAIVMGKRKLWSSEAVKNSPPTKNILKNSETPEYLIEDTSSDEDVNNLDDTFQIMEDLLNDNKVKQSCAEDLEPLKHEAKPENHIQPDKSVSDLRIKENNFCLARSNKALQCEKSTQEMQTAKIPQHFGASHKGKAPSAKSRIKEYLNATQPQLVSNVRYKIDHGIRKKKTIAPWNVEKVSRTSSAAYKNKSATLPEVTYTSSSAAKVDVVTSAPTTYVAEKCNNKSLGHSSPTIIKHAGRAVFSSPYWKKDGESEAEVSVLLASPAVRSHTLKSAKKKE